MSNIAMFKCIKKAFGYLKDQWPNTANLNEGANNNVNYGDDPRHSLDENKEMLIAVSQALSEFINSEQSVNPFDIMLSHILKASQSEFGFVGEVLHDESGHPYLKSHALSNISWDDESYHLYIKSQDMGMEFRNLDSLFG